MSIYKTLFETQENKLKTGIIGMIFITSILAGVFYYEANAIDVAKLDDLQNLEIGGVGQNLKLKGVITEKTEAGTTNENSEDEETFEILEDIERLFFVNCTLTWEDESSNYRFGTNAPDHLGLKLIDPNGKTIDEQQPTPNPQGGTGEVSVSSGRIDYEVKEYEENNIGTWRAVVVVGDCGEDSAQIPILGFRETEDTGNAWTLTISYTKLVEKEDN